MAELSGWASPAELFRDARIIIVDDDSANLALLEKMLTGVGVLQVLGISDPRTLESRVQSWNPDLILLDLHMPHMDGIAVLNMLRATTHHGSFLPVIILTADVTRDAKTSALAAGARDFLSKPFELAEVILRVQNLLSIRALYLRLQRHHSLDLALTLTRDRERIAEELRDTVIQELFGIALSLQSVHGSVDQRAGTRLQSAIDVLDQAIRQLRMTVYALQGPVGQCTGVRARLTAAVSGATDELGFEPRLQFAGLVESIEAATADDLLEVLGEALSNIALHADAGAALVEIDVGRDVVLTVSDNGIGISDELQSGGGLSMMSERARRSGGDCTIMNQPPHGTSVRWHVAAQPQSFR